MNKIVLISSVLVLTACSPSTTPVGGFILPADLAHCTIIKMSQDSIGSDRLYLIKCPKGQVPEGYIGTTTMQTQGKSSVNVTSMIL